MGIARAVLAVVVGAAGLAVNPAPASGAAPVPARTATTTAATTTAAATATAATAAAAEPWSGSAALAASMTAGYALYDRRTGRYAGYRANNRFRSASVVKLLIALDHLWTRDPSDMTLRNRRRLGAMLRRSDDNAASFFWARNGYRQVVLRMDRRLGLTGTVPPPRRIRGWWGYTATTANDTVRIYNYILNRARPAVRGWIMWRLHRARALGSDGFDQRYGVLALAPPRAAKQGWSLGGPPRGVRIPGLNLRSPALHTTGTVGAGDRYVVAVFTLHPRGTRAATMKARVTRLTRSLF